MDYGLLKQYEPLYVIGHKNPDIDSVVSSILLCNILKSHDIECYPCFLDNNYEIEEQSKKMIDDCASLNMKILSSDELDNLNFVLVDHNDPNQSIGLNKRIVWGIDHHPNSKYLSNIYIKMLSSCSLLIFDYFKDYEFSNEEKFMIFMATLDDTALFKKKKIVEKDQDIIDRLGFDLDSEELFNKYFILTDMNKDLKDYLKSPERKYNYRNIEFGCTLINTTDEYEYLKKSFIENINKLEGNYLGIWTNYSKDITYTYFKYNDEIIEKIYDYIAGRALDVIPDIYKYIDKLLDTI